MDRVYCAIGDIHGELERLQVLHQRVFDYAARALPDAELQLVHLGDLVDRGPDSCGVVRYLREIEANLLPPPITLRGNHEQMMIDAWTADDPAAAAIAHWIVNGGDTTLESYNQRGQTPDDDIGWLASLPVIHHDKTAGLVFVHAGVDSQRFPQCTDEVRLWTRRSDFFDPDKWTAPALKGQRVIHGHTPTRGRQPESDPAGRRLNIDTGAVYGGPLTAVVLRPGAPDVFLTV